MAQDNPELTRRTLALEFKEVVNNIFKDNNFECKKLFYKNDKFIGNDIYYSTSDLLKCLHFQGKDEEAIEMIKKLPSDSKFKIFQLENSYAEFDLIQGNEYLELNQKLIYSLTRPQLDEIYVNMQGLFDLIEFFQTDKALRFQKFVYNTLLPGIDEYYQNIINRLKTRIDNLSNRLEALQAML